MASIVARRPVAQSNYICLGCQLKSGSLSYGEQVKAPTLMRRGIAPHQPRSTIPASFSEGFSPPRRHLGIRQDKRYFATTRKRSDGVHAEARGAAPHPSPKDARSSLMNDVPTTRYILERRPVVRYQVKRRIKVNGRWEDNKDEGGSKLPIRRFAARDNSQWAEYAAGVDHPTARTGINPFLVEDKFQDHAPFGPPPKPRPTAAERKMWRTFSRQSGKELIRRQPKPLNVKYVEPRKVVRTYRIKPGDRGLLHFQYAQTLVRYFDFPVGELESRLRDGAGARGEEIRALITASICRKQWGTHYADKVKAQIEDRNRNAVLKVIDSHLLAANGHTLDEDELDAHIKAAQVWKQGIGSYAPLEQEEAMSVKAHILAKYSLRSVKQSSPSPAHHKATAGSTTGTADADEAAPSTDGLHKGLHLDPGYHNHAEQLASIHRGPGSGKAPFRPFTPLRPQNVLAAVFGNSQQAQTRLYHTSKRSCQLESVVPQSFDPPPLDTHIPPNGSLQPDIRARLRQWQEAHGNLSNESRQEDSMENDRNTETIMNPYSRLPDVASLHAVDAQDAEREAQEYFMASQPEEAESTIDARILKMGDLVEVQYSLQDRESLIAVYVRSLTHSRAQCLTMDGRWVIIKDRGIPYSIPEYVPASMVEPVLEHLPSQEDIAEYAESAERQSQEDLSVPREFTAPLVRRMQQFWAESREIYRRNASVLDNAHNILAHETDLRYGSLTAAAVTLLQTPAAKLPVTALFTVRNALTRAGLAFSIDHRSHRLTGYLQIRSKEQVKMVNLVRAWIRDWQDDMAKRAALNSEAEQGTDVAALRRLKTPVTAKYVYSFIDKVRAIVTDSRKDRKPTTSGCISPSKKRFPIRKGEDSIRVETTQEFNEQDQELIRFFEAYTCSDIFASLPRMLALPPLLLQATGLYNDMPDLDRRTAWQFLQEIGTISPYEDRVRFDPHLLLPSSQHSKPLQNLMTTLLRMRTEPNFEDSMKHLRHDWKNTPVYCIDEASAHEIDDGISVEAAGEGLWWVHVHVANPTAFFERDHPAAKMARHMGESLYMPERTYTMLPRWITSKHFSLGKDRPCLTFSMKLDRKGKIQEHKITPGIIRNVISLTHEEVQTVIGESGDTGPERITLTVGGEPPIRRARKNRAALVTEEQTEQLKTLRMLGQARLELRRAAGGVFFSIPKPDIEVWQSHDVSGLAWDHPHRLGRRAVEGDPVIRMRTHKLTNWFSAEADPAHATVMEMMLLAGEVAGMWCAERQIPTIYRGTVRRSDRMHPDVYYRDVLEPATTKVSSNGEWPMHLGSEYVKLIGSSIMKTEPLRHGTLGLDYFGKVTSPLRRYGDMILHWQIEAALREEARRGQSLVTTTKKADRTFLPFSRSVLETIMVGLQPREAMITAAKGYSLDFWVAMVMFRAVHYNECELPFATANDPSKPPMRVNLHAVRNGSYQDGASFGSETSIGVHVKMAPVDDPESLQPLPGDVWEVELQMVDVYNRTPWVKPLRLVDRP